MSVRRRSWKVLGFLAGIGLALVGGVEPAAAMVRQGGRQLDSTPSTCGNGIVDPFEQCDDGNVISGDGCEPDCTWTSVCGDGKLQKNEACDDGNKIPGDGCEPDCTLTPGESSSTGETGTTTMAPTTGEPSMSSGGESSSEDGSSTGEVVPVQDRCGCAAGGDGVRGVFTSVMMLGLIRRRRGRRREERG